MIHSRSDYDHIQDSKGKIPKDEPVMLFRGQDIFAPVALEAYAAMCEASACTMDKDQPEKQLLRDMASTVRAHANLMRMWQKGHGKIPDLP